ncbi:MAG: ketoacyl-ACP synthase III [Bacteroidetes bacterium]|nr:ketoacyl-ACP synthase III [Bacteroidota bacterium]
MIRIMGTGLYVPGESITNIQLADLAGITFDGARLEEKLGIRTRHIAHLRGLNETSADFAEKAAIAALNDAGISAYEIDLFIAATDTPEYISPATAILLQGRLQGEERYSDAFDIGASCASFVKAFDTAARILATDLSMRYILLTGIYNMPAYVRPGDVFGYSIFADGAGAVVLGRPDEGSDSEYIAGQMLTDGTQYNYIGVYSGGTRQPITQQRLNDGEYGLQLLQRLPGDRNIQLWPKIIYCLLDKAGMDLADVDHFLFTQINKTVISEVMGILGRSMDDTTCIMDRYGYTGSGCIPMALHTAISEGKVVRGDTVLAIASGAGLAVGSNLFIY